jgi:hypothetical protein
MYDIDIWVDNFMWCAWGSLCAGIESGVENWLKGIVTVKCRKLNDKKIKYFDQKVAHWVNQKNANILNVFHKFF